MKPFIFVGIDVAKSKHDAHIYNNHTSEVILNKFTFKNTIEGFVSLIAHLQHFDKSDILFGVESTGHYHKALSYWLLNHGFIVGEINPLKTNRLRETQLRKTKTDSIDARVIVQALKLDMFNSLQPHTLSDDIKALSRQRKSFVDERAQHKVNIVNILDVVFPEITSFFSTLHSKTAYCLLLKYGSAYEIAHARIDGLTSALTSVQSKVSPNAMRNLARNSIGQHSDIKVFQLQLEIQTVQMLTLQIERIEAEIARVSEPLDAFQSLLSIPGVALANAASIFGEIGDVSRFESAEKLVAFAGLNPTIYQSGNFIASNASMSKRGSAHLRYALIIAAQAIYRFDPTFNAYYEKKREEGKHFKVIMGHIATKLLRVIYSLLKQNSHFVSQPLF